LLFTWEDILLSVIPVTFFLPRFIRLRLNTLQLAAGMKGKVNRAVARQSEGGLGYGAIPP
jgi:hypothetical protein